MIEPGSTIGIIGGGQLGRMLSVAAAQLGYRCHIFDPHERPVAGDVAAKCICAAFDDSEALERFAAAVDVVTYEFENLPVAPLEALSGRLRPGTRSLEVTQNRAREKHFLRDLGLPTTGWHDVGSRDDLRRIAETERRPLVLKTAQFGYDGKGQAWIRSDADIGPAWQAIGCQPAVLEQAVAFDAEFSVILARAQSGETRAFPVPQNAHAEGILRRSTVPAGASVQPHVARAVEIAKIIARELGHVGVLTVEFFATADGPLVNEIAPRVHNSGHWSIEGAGTSQFEQHIRAICGLPLGSVDLLAERVTMANLIGDDVLAWRDLVAEPGAHLHLYGKGAPRPGRKMGHVTRLGMPDT